MASLGWVRLVSRYFTLHVVSTRASNISLRVAWHRVVSHVLAVCPSVWGREKCIETTHEMENAHAIHFIQSECIGSELSRACAIRSETISDLKWVGVAT